MYAYYSVRRERRHITCCVELPADERQRSVKYWFYFRDVPYRIALILVCLGEGAGNPIKQTISLVDARRHVGVHHKLCGFPV